MDINIFHVQIPGSAQRKVTSPALCGVNLLVTYQNEWAGLVPHHDLSHKQAVG